jgi:hypothetical protein
MTFALGRILPPGPTARRSRLQGHRVFHFEQACAGRQRCSAFPKGAENPAADKRMDVEPTIGFRGPTSSAFDKADLRLLPVCPLFRAVGGNEGQRERRLEANEDEIAVCAYYIKEAVGARGPSARLFGNGILRRLLPHA